MRTLELPFVLDAPQPISSAMLCSRMHLGAELAYNLNVQNNTPTAGKATLSLPAGETLDACPRVWILRLCAPCGLWNMHLAGKQSAPSFPGGYSGTGGADPVVPSCTTET